MKIATTVERFLSGHAVRYGVVPAARAGSGGGANTPRPPAERVVKAVLLRADDDYALAVLPASRRIDWERLREQTERAWTLASEAEVERIFHDCAPGAVPAVGAAYELATIVEASLREQPELYFEAGDHEDLIHVTEHDYETLLGEATYRHFATPS